MVLRFANGLFEPIWNRDHIDHVQITVAEALTVGRRGNYYDATGALRDMVPNHLFQLLSLDRHGAAVALRRGCGARTEGGTARCGAGAKPRRGAAQFGARAIWRRHDRQSRCRSLSRHQGRQSGQHDGNLCRAQADDRQLALGRRAVLSAHRQGVALETHRGGDQVQAGADRHVSRYAGRESGAELPGAGNPAAANASGSNSTPRCRARRSPSAASA